ncbi:MAG: hypothetical protein BGO31_05440 [Bacteroidetes bacterium 43-16]|uniref:hypothetical protein n=1 Tax=uncultured Dysgonomonas sp. TaxID=206096 RepID=UPI00092B4EF6|nr:hypothetical protein [uncultured Dysgonomonas sp.]OJV52275.1 MAG: hypothetical protein BGO31_05440 [Bacteroidetes bacterium 43-16]
MNRTLPTYEIEGVDFLVDVDFNLLRHPRDEKIGYSFLHDMTDTATGYTLTINPDNLLSDRQAEMHGKPVIYEIPYMVKLDPDGMKEKFRTDILPETDIELKNNEDLLYRRSIGKPAAIKVLDDYFFVDTESSIFFGPKVGGRFSSLHTENMPMDSFLTVYQCLYDPTAKLMYHPESRVIPEGVIGLQLPALAYCDSYNYARLHGRLKEPEFFRWHPVRANMAAREIPIEQLGYIRKAQLTNVTQVQSDEMRAATRDNKLKSKRKFRT